MELLVVASVVALLWFALRRANELCAVALTPGGARLLRGRAPARLLADVEDIRSRAGLSSGVLRVVVEAGAPRLLLPPGVSDGVAQQLRNAVGQHRVLHFRTGRRTGS